MHEILEQRRSYTNQRIDEVRSKLEEAKSHCNDSACVYMTGSFGRGEAAAHSDLDVFILGRDLERDFTKPIKSSLKGLNEIIIKADLIHATRSLKIPDFSGEGEYLKHFTPRELVDRLGKPNDDAQNTFTARLLLLLESEPLLGEAVYTDAIEDVIASYWRDFGDHKDDFMPAFLANDILRMWRTFCVNYEANTSSDPPPEKAKRRLKNYKLKHSRMLTCFSAMLYLAFVYSRSKSVTPDQAKHMVSITPTARIEWVAAESKKTEVQNAADELLSRYEEFLKKTDMDPGVLKEQFLNRELNRAYVKSAREFGDVVFKLLVLIGEGTRLHRLLVV